MERSGAVELKVESLDDVPFHDLQVFERVSVGSHFDVVLGAGRVDFLVFAGDPQASDPDKLVLILGDLAGGGVVAEIAEGQVEGLLLKFEGVVDINQPVDEDLPHFGGHFNLLFSGLRFLDLDHEIDDVLLVLMDSVDVLDRRCFLFAPVERVGTSFGFWFRSRYFLIDAGVFPGFAVEVGDISAE